MKRVAVALLAVVVGLPALLLSAFLVTRWGMQAYTRNSHRLEGPDAIDALEKVTIGGISRWIHSRGQDRRNPVILYLHGGPGASMTPYQHVFQAAWERDLTVVQWDQRGAGKTAMENRERPGPEMAKRRDILPGLSCLASRSAGYSSVGARICRVTSSAKVRGWIRRLPPTRPLDHEAHPPGRVREARPDALPTPTGSVERIGTTTTESFTRACGTATFGFPAIVETSA